MNIILNDKTGNIKENQQEKYYDYKTNISQPNGEFRIFDRL